MKLSFEPIARRNLKYVSPTCTMSLTLAVSAPYRPARTPTAGGRSAAACMVLEGDDPNLAVEVGGDDELEALGGAILHIEKFIHTLRSEAAGKLLNEDGTPFEANKTSLLAYFLGKSMSDREGR